MKYEVLHTVTTETNHTKAALETNQYQYFLRLDIKSYYQWRIQPRSAIRFNLEGQMV